MSSHDPALTLRQIVELANEIGVLLAGRSRADLEDRREFLRARERCVELIGEALTRLPLQFREQHSEIPWRQLIGMRNIMIHGYDMVSAQVLWDTASRDVPQLRDAVLAILNEPSR